MSGHGARTLTAEEVQMPQGHSWRKWPKAALVLGVLGLVASFGLKMKGGEGVTEQFLHSYLVAYMYGLSIALGCMFFVLIHYATKAGWSVVLRRIAEAGMSTLPLFALLFIPILMNLDVVYAKWMAQEVQSDHLIHHKAPYLNKPFFLIRCAVYFAIWIGLAFVFRSLSVKQDETGDPAITRKLQGLAYPGIALFALSLTFASIDWVMTLMPTWFSTMYGVIYFASCVLSMFAFMSLVIVGLHGSGLLKNVVTVEHYHDLGKYMFGFTIFWAYVSFSQFMLQWYANIPEETQFFVERMDGWKGVSTFQIWGHFFLPWFYLLIREVKRRAATLALAAAWILVVHFIDIHWQIMPNLHKDGMNLTLLDFTCLLGVVGIFLGAFGLALQKRNLVPVKDPRLPESLAFENF